MKKLLMMSCLVMSACSQPTLIERVKDEVRSQLKDPSSAEFRNVREVRFAGTPKICGEVNAKNSYGGKNGYQRFVSWSDDIIMLEEVDREFAMIWSKVCD